MTPRRAPRRPGAQGGYTYLGLIIFVAVVSVASAATLRLGVAAQRHAAEQALLETGLRLSLALESYARATPQGQDNFAPPDVQSLLRDPRYPQKIVRHLRRLEPDPITGKPAWGIVLTEDKRGIAGFHSLSDAKPLRSVFAPPFADFTQLPRYSDWVFKGGLGE